MPVNFQTKTLIYRYFSSQFCVVYWHRIKLPETETNIGCEQEGLKFLRNFDLRYSSPSNNQRRNPSLCLLLKTFFFSMCPLKFLETIDLTLRPAGRIYGSKKGKDPWPARNPKHRAPGWGYLYVLCTSISELPNYL